MTQLKSISMFSLIIGSCVYWFSFTYLDQPIATSLHQLSHQTLLFNFSQAITLLGDGKISFGFVMISFLIAFLVLLRQPQQRLANGLLFISMAMIAAIFLETVLKFLLGRYRPELLFQQGLYGFHYLSHQYLMNSTPSGHATRIFVLATGFSLMWRKLTPIFILLGFFVCFSRLVLEFHFLSDVLFGALLGTLTTLWVAKTYYSLTLFHRNYSVFRPIK